MAPPPAVKPASTGPAINLVRPDLDDLMRADPPFTAVLEGRRSVRDYAPRPITVEQLGEFFYRVARVKALHETEADTSRGPIRMEIALRPFPAGGSLHELEFYVAAAACERLDPGLYHYEPQPHRLARLCGPSAEVAHLLRDAADSAGIRAERVQILVILASRFPRLAWKYASIAYSLTLKHVGVVYQTMYLVATAMGLAPCALGAGDSDCFARATGIDSLEETSVGEFLIGSGKADC
jgi:SagB-type dehydrogenase family enzyme